MPFHKAIRLQSLSLRCRWKIVQFCLSRAPICAWEKRCQQFLNVIPLRQCTWDKHRWLLINVAIYANNSEVNIFDSFYWPNERQSRDSNRQVVGSLLLSDCTWVALSSAMVTECRAKRKQFSTFRFCLMQQMPITQFESAICHSNFVAWLHKAQTSAILIERRTICTPFGSSIVLIDFDWSNERQSCNSNRQFVVTSFVPDCILGSMSATLIVNVALSANSSVF